MASPERARFLFLSSHVSSLVDTKSGRRSNNNGGNRTYLHELEEHDKKKDDAAWDSGDDNGHPSRTSTIRAVEDFFQEYRPPSFRLKRLSYLDKALPPPPPADSDAGDEPTDEDYVLAGRENIGTHIATRSRYSTQSNISAASTSRRGSNHKRVSVRSRYSTQTAESEHVSDVSLENERPRPDRRPSQISERRRTYPRKQSRGSIPYRRTMLEGVDEEKEAHKEKEKEMNDTTALEKDPWLLEHTQGSLESDDIAYGNKLKDMGMTGDGAPVRSNSAVRKIVKTSSDAFASFYNQCATSLEHRKSSSTRRKDSKTSDSRQAGLFAGCFWSRDGQFDDIA